VIGETKKCFSCKEVLDLSLFNKNSSNFKDGRSSWCRRCASDKNKARYLANIDVTTAKRRESARDPEFQKKNRERTKAWRRADPGRAKKAFAEWKANNPESFRAAKKKHYVKNEDRYKKAGRDRYLLKKDEIQKYIREWCRKNPDRVRLQGFRKRERERNASGSAAAEQVASRVLYYGGLCYICLKDADAVDHVIPLAGGGTCWPANLRPICTPCNSRKGARIMPRDLPRFIAQARLTESAL
jgi:5-methylcytosine-specific restriction endonuclease McrA